MRSFSRRGFLGTGLAGAASAWGAEQEGGKVGRTPHTKFAVNCEMWWRKLPFLKRLESAAALGFPAVEFWPYENKDLDAVKRLTRELKLDIAQFTAWGFRPGMNHPENEKKFIAKIEEACGVARNLDVDRMCVVAGNNQKGMSKDQMLSQVTRALKGAAPVAEKHKVMLILEPMNRRNHPGHCLYGSPDAVAICRDVGSEYVKINWDLYHMQIEEGDLCGRMKDGWDQVGYFQLADVPGRHEPGTGEVHYNRVLKEAHTLGYRGYVGLECVPTDENAAARAVAAADVW